MTVHELMKNLQTEEGKWFNTLTPKDTNKVLMLVDKWVDGEAIPSLLVYDKTLVKVWAKKACPPREKPGYEDWEEDLAYNIAGYEVFDASQTMFNELEDKIWFMYHELEEQNNLNSIESEYVTIEDLKSYHDDCEDDDEITETNDWYERVSDNRINHYAKTPGEWTDEDDINLIVHDIERSEENEYFRLLKYVESKWLDDDSLKFLKPEEDSDNTHDLEHSMYVCETEEALKQYIEEMVNGPIYRTFIEPVKLVNITEDPNVATFLLDNNTIKEIITRRYLHLFAEALINTTGKSYDIEIIAPEGTKSVIARKLDGRRFVCMAKNELPSTKDYHLYHLKVAMLNRLAEIMGVNMSFALFDIIDYIAKLEDDSIKDIEILFRNILQEAKDLDIDPLLYAEELKKDFLQSFCDEEVPF